MISIQNINFSYSKGEPLFKNFSLDVQEGSIFGLLGPNGSGKTTLMRLILNLIHLQGGNIRIFGETNHRNNLEIRHKIGALIESPSLYGHLSGRENLKLFAKVLNVDNARIDECLKLVDMNQAADKKFKKYSLGMKQRLAIASTMLHNPPLILLDEPMNGLDPQGMHDIRNLIIRLNKEEGKSIFISSHILSEIESTCTDIGIIKHGQTLFSGKTEDLRKQMHANRQLIIRTSEAKSAMEQLKADYAVRMQEDGIILDLNDSQENHHIIHELTMNNIPVSEAFNQQNNLESLFLELTK